MTILDMVEKLVCDEEFRRGGIPKDERAMLDAVGFEYTVSGGTVKNAGEDANELYAAVATIVKLSQKYDRSKN